MNFQYNRGKSVLDLPSEDPVTDYFDGGETINVKVRPPTWEGFGRDGCF